MTIFSSTQPSLSVRVLPRFPAQVIAGTGMTITKSGNVYTFAADVIATLSDMPDMASDRLLGRDTDGSGSPEELTVSGGLGFTAAGGIQMDSNQRIKDVVVILDGGGSELSTGVLSDTQVNFAGTIVGVTLLADQTGSIVIDIWKDVFANYPPTDADSITASAVPTISSDISYSDTTLTGWTTSIAAGDTLRYNVDSVTTVTRCAVVLKVMVT